MQVEDKARILVVDDNPSKRLALAAVLEELNQTIVIAESGRDALRLLLRHEYAVILMDVQMPDMDGFETAALIRSRKQSEATPIIFVTAYARAELDMLHGYSQGAVDYVFTPIIPEILRAKVSVFVELDHKTRAIRQHEEHLERLVVQRTAALTAEIEQRKQAEEKISQMNVKLEQRVRERTAALEAINRELESFSYSVSHDLRAPLRHINGYIQMLLADSASTLSPDARRHLNVVTDASQQMGQLIDDLLEFSQMGRAEMREARVDLDALVQEAVGKLETDVRGRAIAWQAAPLPPVLGDVAMLRQVFANLLGNAVKYTRPREAAQIEIGSAGEDDSRLVVFVRDNGVGFDMRYADKLFGVFQRLHRADEFEGTGIGLASVRRIIERHGGRVWAEGQPGTGATFYFTLSPADGMTGAPVQAPCKVGP